MSLGAPRWEGVSWLEYLSVKRADESVNALLCDGGRYKQGQAQKAYVDFEWFHGVCWLIENGASGGIRTPNQRIMLTTIAFATLSVCSLDFIFIRFRIVAVKSLHVPAYAGFARGWDINRSPNLTTFNAWITSCLTLELHHDKIIVYYENMQKMRNTFQNTNQSRREVKESMQPHILFIL